MEKELEHYLSTVDNHLKKMPISERIDIIKELKAYIEELKMNENMSPQDIIEKIGSPKELAIGYLGKAISINTTFNLKKISMLISFYGLTSLTGMFVIPCGGLLAVTLMPIGIATPFLGLIGAIGYLLGFDIPWTVIQLGFYKPSPLVAFPLSIPIGIGSYLLGKALWKLVLRYIKKVSQIKQFIDAE